MTELVTHDTLYNVDAKGKVRVWYMQTEGGKHRVVSGLQDGKQTVGKWVVVEAKNVGRSNGTTPEEQALLEVKSDYTRKLEQKYDRTIEEARANGADKKKFFEPMLAHKYKDRVEKLDKGEVYYYQPKLDGIRAVVNRDGLASRQGKPIPACQHVYEQLKPVFEKYPDLILDGELYNHTLKDDFNTLSSLIKKGKPTSEDLDAAAEKVFYYVYDIASGTKTFGNRTHDLYRIFTEEFVVRCVVLVETHSGFLDEGDVRYSEWLAEGYEGMMVRLDTPYERGRSNSLLKRKEFFDAEYKVKAVEEGRGNWSGIAKRIVCLDEKTGEEFEATPKGTMEQNKKLLEGPKPDYATVRYPNLTPRGVPRFGIAVDFHWGEREH